MGSSIRIGVYACQNVADGLRGVVVMACDQPAVTAPHVKRLMEDHELCASRYAGRNGVPAFFPREHFASLMSLNGDTGARELLSGASQIDLPYGELDVDTADELARARELLG